MIKTSLLSENIVKKQQYLYHNLKDEKLLFDSQTKVKQVRRGYTNKYIKNTIMIIYKKSVNE